MMGFEKRAHFLYFHEGVLCIAHNFFAIIATGLKICMMRITSRILLSTVREVIGTLASKSMTM